MLDDPWSRTLIATLSHPDTRAPQLHHLLESCYRHLLAAAVQELPQVPQRAPTRMTAAHPAAMRQGTWIDRNAPTVIVDIARGGMVPSYVLQQELLQIMDPDVVRVDHLYMQRVAGDDGHIIGVSTTGSKIGGPGAGATVFFPDPMGATGSSLASAHKVYQGLKGGPPRRTVALHLIVTPEYLRRVSREAPGCQIYALSLDRGLSSDEVLQTRPGERWDEERGLDRHDYIVPGAGGLGELINNAFV